MTQSVETSGEKWEELSPFVVSAIKRWLEEQTEYVGDTYNLESVCLDGWFNLEEFAQTILEAAKKQDTPLPTSGEKKKHFWLHCQLCDACFTYQDDLQVHEQEEHGLSPLPTSGEEGNTQDPTVEERELQIRREAKMEMIEAVRKQVEYTRGWSLADNPPEIQQVWKEGLNTGLDHILAHLRAEVAAAKEDK